MIDIGFQKISHEKILNSKSMSAHTSVLYIFINLKDG